MPQRPGEHNQVTIGATPGQCAVLRHEVLLVVGSQTANSRAGLGETRDGLVEVGAGVELASPEIFAVGWVVAAGVALLGSVVHDGDTAGKDDKCEGVLEEGLVVLLAQPSRVIMIVNEGCEYTGVAELCADLVVHVDHGLRISLLLVEAVHGVVHSVVQEARHDLGVSSEIIRASVPDLTDSIDTSSLLEVGPEILLNMLDGVDADAVEAVLSNEPLDPIVKNFLNGCASCVKVGKTGNLALLNAVLVVVVDVAWGVNTGHWPSIRGIRQQCLIKHVSVVVAQALMIHTSNNRGNPDGIKAHPLDIIELGLETLEGSTTIISEISTRVATSIVGASSDTIGKGKVDVSRLPGVCVCCLRKRADAGSHQGGELEESHGGGLRGNGWKVEEAEEE
ncbi:hypothetical protein HG530_010503 [Fusarium avenaceum]|nr:hypothetical protein HG530_010503 [Fusarium avenaceum]